MNWYLYVMKNYAVFTGRARRKEYWMFVLFNMLIGICIGIVIGIGKGAFHVNLAPINLLYQLAILIPSIAVAIRRMHDTGRSGWWTLCPFANIVFLCLKSEPNANRFGPPPSLL